MFKKIIFLSVLLFPLFFALPGQAASSACECSNGSKKEVANCGTACSDFCTTKGAQVKSCTPNAGGNSGGTVKLDNPLGSVTSPQQLIGKIINTVLGLVGSIALLMFVYGGLVWMTSAGSAEKVKKGREIIVWSAIGLAIIFASYGAVRIIISAVQ